MELRLLNTIPDKDTNTKYSVEISKSVEGNTTTVTVTLKGDDGSTSSESFTLTDKDTITEDTTLDPSLFWMDENGVIWYGLKTDKDNCIKQVSRCHYIIKQVLQLLIM